MSTGATQVVLAHHPVIVDIIILPAVALFFIVSATWSLSTWLRERRGGRESLQHDRP